MPSAFELYVGVPPTSEDTESKPLSIPCRFCQPGQVRSFQRPKHLVRHVILVHGHLHAAAWAHLYPDLPRLSEYEAIEDSNEISSTMEWTSEDLEQSELSISLEIEPFPTENGHSENSSFQTDSLPFDGFRDLTLSPVSLDQANRQGLCNTIQSSVTTPRYGNTPSISHRSMPGIGEGSSLDYVSLPSPPKSPVSDNTTAQCFVSDEPGDESSLARVHSQTMAHKGKERLRREEMKRMIEQQREEIPDAFMALTIKDGSAIGRSQNNSKEVAKNAFLFAGRAYLHLCNRYPSIAQAF